MQTFANVEVVNGLPVIGHAPLFIGVFFSTTLRTGILTAVKESVMIKSKYIRIVLISDFFT
jgi:hypothetical protein